MSFLAAAVIVLQVQKQAPLVGFNQNWSYMPPVEGTDFVKNVCALGPQIVRYPGGTVTHFWDWRKGIMTTRNTRVPQPLENLKRFCDLTNSKPIFVLDIANRTLDDQLEMLSKAKRLGMTVTHVELGNELYAQDKGYEKVFPTGKEYGARAALWCQAVKREFPGVKVAPLLLARAVRPSNTRMFDWNRLTLSETRKDADAYTYHLYIGESGGTFDSVAENFRKVTERDSLGSKEIWVTEYGSQKKPDHPDYLFELSKLADFVEGFPSVAVALSHQILGGEMNKLSRDGSTLTPEGTLFVQRARRRGANHTGALKG